MRKPAIGILGQALIPLAIGTGLVVTAATLAAWWRDIEQERSITVQRLAQQAELRSWVDQPYFDHVVENLTHAAGLLPRRLAQAPAGSMQPQVDGTIRHSDDRRAVFVGAAAVANPQQVAAAEATWHLLEEYGPTLSGSEPTVFIAVPGHWLVGWGSDAVELADSLLPDDPVLLPAETAALAQPGTVRWSQAYLEPATGHQRIAAVTSVEIPGIGRVAVTQVLTIDQLLARATAGQRQDGETVVYDTTGRILGSTRAGLDATAGRRLPECRLPLYDLLARQVPADGPRHELLTLADGSGWLGISRIQGPGWVMATFHPAAAIMREARSAAWQSLIIGLGILTAQTILLVVVLRWRVSRPLRRLAGAAQDLAAGSHDIHLDTRRSDEIGRLSQAFLSMATAIASREAALREREQMARALVASAADAVLLLADDRITEANPRACALFATDQAGLVGRRICDLSPDQQPDGQASHEREAQLRQHATCGEAVHFAWRHRRSDGSEFDAEIGLARIDLQGPQRLVAVVRDVTARNQLQEQLRQSQKMESIGQLAGGIAHDFNNMLAGIMGSAELIATAKDTDQRERLIQQIITSSERAAGLTRKLLSFARKGRVSRAQVDVHRIIHDTLGMLGSSFDKRITLHHDLSAVASAIVGDASLLQSALLNLAVNARDAMPDGGTLGFATRLRELDAETAALQPMPVAAGRYIEIAVSDTGCGIPHELIERIFEPFFTTKPVGKGTGLGLAAVWGTVQDHQGSISVVSTPGTGTTFALLLPLAEDEHPQANRPETRPNLHTGIVLVVEDEPAIRDNLCRLLTTLGWQVLEAADGQAGVDLFANHHRDIDVVILDMELPRLRGGDCLRTMRRINPRVRAILASGYAGETTSEQLLADGFRALVAKPFRRDDLLRALDTALAGD